MSKTTASNNQLAIQQKTTVNDILYRWQQIQEASTDVQAIQLQRKTIIFNLRVSGLSIDQIVEYTGVNIRTVKADIQDAINLAKAELKDSAEQFIHLELERLDKIQLAFWDKAMMGNDRAANVILSAMKQRAALLGLNQPIGIMVKDNTITVEYADDWKNVNSTVIKANTIEGEIINNG